MIRRNYLANNYFIFDGIGIKIMWPFKTKKQPTQQPSIATVATTVLCIPGTWADINEIHLKIVTSTNGDYMAAGGIIMNAKTERHYTFEICDRDERMRHSFSYAGRTSAITIECLDEIGKHNFVIYISGQTGNLKEARNIALAAAALLNAGGLGVKVETAGKAFEKDKWLASLEDHDEANLYDLFVIGSILNEDKSVFSCGMHNLGLKDTIVSGLEFHHAVNLIRIFAFYQIVDKPIIQHNQTFQADLQSPYFRITYEPNQPYKDTELFGNPYGMWRLTAT